MKVSKTIHVEMTLLDKAEKKARETNVSLNYVIEQALKQYLEVE